MLVESQKMSKSGIGRKVATHIRRSVLAALLLFFVMSTAAIPAHGQANVNEGQESNFIYVDTVNGNNSNPGTQAEPLQTIGAAVALATAVAGTTGSRIIVNPGTYRESISFINAPANNLPIAVQAATNGTVTSNAPGSPANIPLTGTGVQAIVKLSPTSLSFGNQLENMTSAAQNVTLTNTGNTALSITNIAVTGTDSNWYAESNTCGTSVAAGASCTITATFTPLQGGPASPSINLTDTGTGSPQSIALSGTGVIPTATLAPMSLNFGNVNLGTSSSPLTATLTNSGTAALALSSIGISGTNSNDYSETNTCGTSVPIGATCMITVAFTPQATGSTSADVTFTDDAKNSPQSLSLSGTGTVPGISFNPTSVSFGTQTVGKKSAGQKITVTNTGTGTLTLTSVTLTGANPGDFSLTDGCGTSLSAGKTCTVTAFFDPTLTGLRSADVTFADNAPGGPQEVALTGTGD
jgi:hypothetical protein